MTENERMSLLEDLRLSGLALQARWAQRLANPLKEYPIEFDVLGPVKKSKRRLYKRLQKRC